MKLQKNLTLRRPRQRPSRRTRQRPDDEADRAGGQENAGVLRPGCRCEPGQIKEGRNHRLRQPRPCACQQPARQRGKGSRRCAAARFGFGQEGRGGGVARDEFGGSCEMGGHRHGADARRAAGRPLRRRAAPQHARRHGARFRAWPQHPFPPDRAASRYGRVHDRAEGTRPHGPLGISARRRRPVSGRGRAEPVRATRSKSRSLTPRQSAAAAPGSSRRPSGRNARPICSASSRCCAAV